MAQFVAATLSVADVIPPVNDLPEVPEVPAGAPTLAKHLGRALQALRSVGGVYDFSAEQQKAFEDGCAALRALPRADAPTITINGEVMWKTEEGGYLPQGLVKEHKKLEDDFVRTVVSGALAISASIERFKKMTFVEAPALVDNLKLSHGVEMGGKAGNTSFHSFDRRYRVAVKVQDRLTVGPTIEVAKAALNEWLAETQAGPEVKALIEKAFGIDDQGRVRAKELVRLRELEISHPSWLKAMKAIDDAMEVASKAVYLNCHERQPDGKYKLIPLDLAAA